MKRLFLLLGLSAAIVTLSGCQSMRNWCNRGTECQPTCGSAPTYTTPPVYSSGTIGTVEQLPN